MSYLDLPRIHFAGAFQADPSTVNNNLENYRPQNTSPAPSWNPSGTARFGLIDCIVRSTDDTSGTRIDSEQPGSIVGARVLSPPAPAMAKIVDLDPQQQLVSEIYGLQVRLAVSSDDFVTGRFGVTCFQDIWWTRLQGSGGGDVGASAFYQSILEDVTWGSGIGPLLQALREACARSDLLSMKFVLDSYNNRAQSADFTRGRVVGTIGPASPDEPPNFVAGRLLRPRRDPATIPTPPPELWYAPAKIDPGRWKAVLDLGNSLPTPGDRQPDLDLGNLQAAVLGQDGAAILLGPVDFTQATYERTAAIHEFDLAGALTALDLPDDQIELLRLAIVRKDDGGSQILLSENRTASFLNATRFVHRLDPGDTAEVTLVALEHGRPGQGQQISLSLDPSLLPDGSQTVPVGQPEGVLTLIESGTERALPTTVSTDATGRATFSLKASDPGNPRRFIDGQVYGLRFSWEAENDPEFPPDFNSFLSILVFDSFDEEPIWDNVKVVMEQYAKLYPFMNELMELGDPKVLQARAPALRRVFGHPITDSRYMPVTRDLSRDKKAAIIAWLNSTTPTG